MKTSRTLLFAATILAVPAGLAFAQTESPSSNMGTNRSVTAAPGTADSQSATGMHTGDVGNTNAYSPTRPTNRGTTAANPYPANGHSAAANPYHPGATGQTVVPGDNSSMANVSPNTRAAQTQGTTTGGNK